MYNLLVSSSTEAWLGDPLMIDLGRCVREYTDTKITSDLGELEANQIVRLCQLPTIFAYEEGCDENPKFGLIKDVTRRQDKVKIEYEILPQKNFLSYQELSELQFELDIIGSELYRTHWAVKDVDLAKELKAKDIRLPAWASSNPRASVINITNHEFDVALSFPGGTRDLVNKIAQELESLIGQNSYFYDKNYQAQLARPSLDSLLHGIYGERSKLVVVFLCAEYQNKEWCGVEFRAIKEIIKRRQNDKVMFIRVDDAPVEGVFSTDGYIDAKEYDPKELAGFIIERLAILK